MIYWWWPNQWADDWKIQCSCHLFKDNWYLLTSKIATKNWSPASNWVFIQFHLHSVQIDTVFWILYTTGFYHKCVCSNMSHVINPCVRLFSGLKHPSVRMKLFPWHWDAVIKDHWLARQTVNRLFTIRGKRSIVLLVRGGIMSGRKSDAKALSHLTDAVIVRDQSFMKKWCVWMCWNTSVVNTLEDAPGLWLLELNTRLRQFVFDL